ncbi:zinc-finger domain-containing protein [Aquidulcibacter sp.]|uniref:zinc-finger domain-containing protein n=1 Tax=Aquidulcibacter sp. TaxID=2052990 RepID=UPI0025C236A0|nr:zinc-finger domain-containing protein [Aquidulcibacter sp.]MCA3693376.1 zinc-finger domain-containing protein [Aquidulcibacter sp.]
MSVSVPLKTNQPVETIYVDGHRIACDGGGGALGHPKVWYEMGDEGQVECLYCGRLYVQKTSEGGATH